MSPSTGYLTAYEKQCVREIGETWIKITLADGRARLTPETELVKNHLLVQLGVNKLCQLIRIKLEETRSRDMNLTILDISASLSSPKK